MSLRMNYEEIASDNIELMYEMEKLLKKKYNRQQIARINKNKSFSIEWLCILFKHAHYRC